MKHQADSLSRSLFAYLLRLYRLFRASEVHTMLLWAVLTGFVGALATIGFREGIKGLQWLLVGRSGSLVEMAKVLPWYARIALPALGGIAAGLILLWAKRFTAGAASDYMEAVAFGDGRIPARHTLLRSVSSLVTIASGGSIGREGSMIQLAAMCASLIGRLVRFAPDRLRLLVACGAAAGITSAYNAPIAGAFFVAEIVLGAIVIDTFGPLVISAIVANLTMRAIPGYHPTYEMPMFPAIADVEMLAFALLGIIAGLVTPLFLKLLNFSKTSFRKSGLPLPLRLGLGGLGVGIISVWVPQVWGNGYSVVNSLLHEPWMWTAVLAVLVCKVVATAFTAGSGAVGGVFTPTLFTGAATGFLFGQILHALWPHATSPPFAYAIAGMGAFLATATSAPLMAILMIFEMTWSAQALLPLMLSCIIAYFIARLVSETTMYEITSKRNQVVKARSNLRGLQMADLVKPAETVLPLNASFIDITNMFRDYPVKYIYIVDQAGRFSGVVASQEMTSILLDQIEAMTRTATDFLRRDFPVLTKGMSLGEALKFFLAHQGERLPVIESKENPVLMGVVYKSSLLDTYYRLHQPLL